MVTQKRALGRAGRRGPARAGIVSCCIGVVLAACASGGDPALHRPPPAPAPQPAAVAILPQQGPAGGELGPEVLLPAPDATDAEVARVGDLVLRQSHAFVRLLSADPKMALSAVDLLVFDVLVAQHARQFGIRVDEDRVRQLAQQEEQALQQQVQNELGGRLSFADYVWRIFGMRLEDWRRNAEVRTAQRQYHGYVIRYLGAREDRVQVRYVAHQDRAVIDDVAAKVRDGADFATLALRHSEDAFRRDGGLLPPFGPGFPHPAATVAFRLAPGQLSEPFQQEVAGEKRWYLVYCLERQPGRDLPFAALRAEIEADLERRPLSPIEINAYTLRWRGELERGDQAPGSSGGRDR